MPAEQELTEKQLAKIQFYVRDERALNRAVASTLTRHRASYIGRKLAQHDMQTMRRMVLEKIRSLPSGVKQQVHDTVCVGYDWCRRRTSRSYNDVVTLVRILAPILAGNPWAGLIAHIVFMAKHRLFDRLCKCP